MIETALGIVILFVLIMLAVKTVAIMNDNTLSWTTRIVVFVLTAGFIYWCFI